MPTNIYRFTNGKEEEEVGATEVAVLPQSRILIYNGRPCTFCQGGALHPGLHRIPLLRAMKLCWIRLPEWPGYGFLGIHCARGGASMPISCSAARMNGTSLAKLPSQSMRLISDVTWGNVRTSVSFS